MRSSVIQTLDNVSLIVPNSKFIENNVVNWSHGDPTIRLHVPIGVAYGSDLEAVTRVLLQVAGANARVLKHPDPEARFQGFGDSALNFELLVWIDRPGEQYQIRSQINYAIDAAFRAAGISIPFPQRDLRLQSSEAVDQLARAIRREPDE
ncbi:MAG: mechanosensitive ion channel [bacterium]|nr:mechanosensitive ion channel [bacterium]